MSPKGSVDTADHLTVHPHGSICLIEPRTRKATRWLKDNVQPDAAWFGNCLVAEPRYVRPLLEGFLAFLKGEDDC